MTIPPTYPAWIRFAGHFNTATMRAIRRIRKPNVFQMFNAGFLVRESGKYVD